MKIVINRCYGGFSLSCRAVKRYYELKGRECYFYKGKDVLKNDYNRISDEEAFNASRSDTWRIHAFDTPDYAGLGLDKVFDNWSELSMEERQASNQFYGRHSLDARIDEENRNDPHLVQVVEELGSEAASGPCAKLEIVKIPDDIVWEISEYDGMERVEEVHRSWG